MNRLDHWHLVLNRRHTPALRGIRQSDGHNITTSPIASVEGRIAHTSSGSVYELGDPIHWYWEWLDAHCCSGGEKCPVPAAALELRSERGIFP